MIYIYLADGFEEIEGLTVVDLLRREEIGITMVSMSDTLTVTGGHNIKIVTDIKFEDADFSDATMYILPGGLMGTNRLMVHEGLDRILREAPEKGIKLGAICAGPSVLGQKGLLNGKRAICYPGFEDKLIGATIVNNAVVEDGDVVTSKGMGTGIEFALKIVEIYVGREKRDQLSESIQYE